MHPDLLMSTDFCIRSYPSIRILSGYPDRILFTKKESDVNSHKHYAQHNSGVKQPFFKTAAGLNNVAASAKYVGQAGRFILQGNYYYQQQHHQNVQKAEN
jgi:hypothetical protein